jgi:hypothetical protein
MAAFYQAALYCDDCADVIRERIWLESDWGTTYSIRKSWEDAIGYDDETMYDSDDYPKWCDDDEESDRPDHCANGEDCVNAQELEDGSKCGYFFGNSLTEDGEEYVRNKVREDIAIGCTDQVACAIWMPYYDWIDYSDEEGV